jgi:type IV secretion system protein VirD4
MGFLPQAHLPTEDAEGWVTYRGSSHLATFGQTGAGKTIQIIANLLEYQGSMIVFDSKGDIFAATARRRREMGQEVHTIDLRDSGRTGLGSLNPLDLAVRSGTEIAVIARSLAANIVARTGQERDRFWNDWAETCLAGAIGYTIGLPAGERHIGTVFDLYNNDDVDYKLAVLLDQHGKAMNRASYAAFAALLQLPERDTRPSVLGTTQAALRLWDSDLIRQITSTTSFDLDALINQSDRRPMTLYFIVPSYREAYQPLLRLWFGGLLSALMQREWVPVRRTLIVSDETASFGRVDSFVTTVTQARSYGIQLWTHWQNLSQLQIYGPDGAHTLVDNSGVLQFLGAANHRVASEFAALMGGISGEEIMALGPNEQVLLMDGRVLKLRRFRYFEEARFAGLYDPIDRSRK